MVMHVRQRGLKEWAAVRLGEARWLSSRPPTPTPTTTTGPVDGPPPFDEPFHPSPEDNAWAARELNDDGDADLAGADERAAWAWLCGLECHADRITDEDMARCGAVG